MVELIRTAPGFAVRDPIDLPGTHAVEFVVGVSAGFLHAFDLTAFSALSRRTVADGVILVLRTVIGSFLAFLGLPLPVLVLERLGRSAAAFGIGGLGPSRHCERGQHAEAAAAREFGPEQFGERIKVEAVYGHPPARLRELAVRADGSR